MAREDNVKHFNDAENNNRDSADYSTSIRTNCYYLRIFCWLLNRAVHTLYVVVCHLTYLENGKQWEKYKSKHNGRHDFQIDLGLALLAYGIGLDWDGELKHPDYMPSLLHQCTHHRYQPYLYKEEEIYCCV